MKHHPFQPLDRLLQTVILAFTLFTLAPELRAQVPTLVNYQGRVAVDAVNFEGPGLFKFALVNEAGDTTFWSNDGTSTIGDEPTDAVSLAVAKGLYSVLLGDTAILNALGGNMPAIDPAVFTNPDVRLRVWFDDGVNGSQLLTPDQRLAPAVYLADGTVGTAALADASVVAAKIAPATIDGTHVAAGALDFTHLTTPAAPGAGQVLGYDGASLSWVAPGGGDSVWTLNGASAYYNGGNVGIGTTMPLHKLGIAGGPLWTSNSWSGAIELANANAIAWRTNTSGWGFGIGHTNGGMAFFRTNSEPADVASPALYDMFINDAGQVAIGTLSPNPGYRLAVNGSAQFIPGGTGGTMQIGTPNFESGLTWATVFTRADLRFDGATVKLVAGLAGGPPGNTAGLAVRTNGNVGVGTDDPQTKLHVVGTTRTSILTITGGADLAEPFPIGGGVELEKGSVVVIDPDRPGALRRSTQAYDRRVAGIVSGANGVNAGIALHQEGVLEGGQNVSLTGRVYVLADATSGAIRPGDLLTTSDTPGHAMRVSDHARAPGAVLGKAMSALAEGTGYVLVLVSLQ